VKPGALYLLGGWLKSIGLKGTATIHAHFHDASGALAKSGAIVSTATSVSGDSDWVNTMGFFRAPPDAASITVHLTMNTAGALRHDGIVLCEVWTATSEDCTRTPPEFPGENAGVAGESDEESFSRSLRNGNRQEFLSSCLQ
jgi:hypothetical protein